MGQAGAIWLAALLSACVPEPERQAIYVAAARGLHATRLASLGLRPENWIHVSARRTEDCAWATLEALRCPRVCVVLSELKRADLTRSDTLTTAVHGVDAIVFALGSDCAGKVGAENVDYGGVRNVLSALGSRTARISLMTSIGVTNCTGSYNQATEAHYWKRRSERLVRASGLP